LIGIHTGEGGNVNGDHETNWLDLFLLSSEWERETESKIVKPQISEEGGDTK
jgi:hypothetical protein